MRVFKNTRFDRFAKKESIGDDELGDVATAFEKGEWDADLGSGLFKKRIARPGEGKRGGYRVLVFFKSGERIFFAYGFAKNVMGDVSKKEKKILRATAKEMLAVSDAILQSRIESGDWIEIAGEEAGK